MRPHWKALETHFDNFEPTQAWFDRDIEIRLGLQSWCDSIESIIPLRQLGTCTLIRVASVQHRTEGKVLMFIVTGILPFFMVGLPSEVEQAADLIDVGVEFLTYFGYLGLFVYSNPPFNPLRLRDNGSSNLLSNSKKERIQLLNEINACLKDVGLESLHSLSSMYPKVDLTKRVAKTEWIPQALLDTIVDEKDVVALFRPGVIQAFNRLA